MGQGKDSGKEKKKDCFRNFWISGERTGREQRRMNTLVGLALLPPPPAQ